jgi:hypothetical protein
MVGSTAAANAATTPRAKDSFSLLAGKDNDIVFIILLFIV